jgi:DNA-directed RNA polymerase subunit M/transcription elongation factor TFIIS
MPLFCTSCNNLLVVSTTMDSFYFKCNKCEKIEQPNELDSLRYEDVSGTNYSTHGTILRNAANDPVNPKVAKLCNNCGNKTARQIRLGNDMRIINTCIKCNEQWIDGTRDNENNVTGGKKVK